jgi:hypothetical protein
MKLEHILLQPLLRLYHGHALIHILNGQQVVLRLSKVG